MIYTPLYYDKNNYERKKKQSKQPHVEGGCPVVVALLTWLPLLHCTVSQPPITLPPQHPISTLLAAVVGDAAIIINPHSSCWSPSSLLEIGGDMAISTQSPPVSKFSQWWVSGAGILPPHSYSSPSPCHHPYAPAFLPMSSFL